MTPSLFDRLRTRPQVSHLTLNLLVSVWIMAVLNAGFWTRLASIFDGSPVQFALFAFCVFVLTVFTLELLAPGPVQKPVAAALVLIAASASYYERSFGVLIDREMVRNVFETTVTESKHLITPAALLRIGLTGALPAALIFWPVVRRRSLLQQVWRWPLGVALSFAVLAAGLFGDFKAFSAVLRERHDLMGSYQPGATVSAVYRYARQQWRTVDPVASPIATDARKGPWLEAADKPVLLVLYAGETLRAQNFGLNGYARDTTPGLAARNVINYPDVSACGTSTAVSLPCMFSALDQADYSREAYLSQENLLDVLVRAGFAVRWVDNNTGDQKIATRTGWDQIDSATCEAECMDDVFLPIIQDALDTITEDTVLVLHMIGNHGPAYFLRYPKDRAVFTPDCQSVQFSDCEVAHIVNAYDNAALFTDHVLSQTIDMMAASDRVLPAMMFLSDHGESLGENGLYLHAAPLFMAPVEQTKVPMVIWMDDRFRQAMQFDDACLRDLAARPASHDNMFHTVLGMVNVTTTARNPDLDLVSPCQTPKENG